MAWFLALEDDSTRTYTSIHIKLDDYIPFNEWFVIPYLFWFAYVVITVSCLFFKTNKEDFYRYYAFLFIGMFTCLIIYTIWPNRQTLRPDLTTLGRDNILIRIVGLIYKLDTPTNVCPSIHVYNSIGTHIAISKNAILRNNKLIYTSSFLLMILISLSTMFLKQHSAFDSICAVALVIIVYLIVYYEPTYIPDKNNISEEIKEKIFVN